MNTSEAPRKSFFLPIVLILGLMIAGVTAFRAYLASQDRGVAPSIDTKVVNAATLTGTVDGALADLADILGKVKDEATAKSAMGHIVEVVEQVKGLKLSSQPESIRTELQTSLAESKTRLDTLLAPVLESPEIKGVLSEKLEELRQQLP